MRLSEKCIFCFALILVVFCGPYLRAQSLECENIPESIIQSGAWAHFADTYMLDGAMNPFYLRGDFDGDGKPDYALWIKAKTGGATGIAIWLSTKHKFVILGAGSPFRFAGSTESNFDNLNVWQVYGKRSVERGVEAGAPPHLIGEAILVGRTESGSGLIYWNRKVFKWYQQGD